MTTGRRCWTRTPFDLVCIATPTVLHAPQTLAALAKGAHVMCEKPTAMDAAEAQAMLRRGRGGGAAST